MRPRRDLPEWGSAFVIVPWQQYQFDGDRQLLRRYYDGMKRYVAYLGSKACEHIVSHGLGDWYDIGPGPPGPAQLTPNALTATAFYYYDTWILAQTAAILDKPQEAEQYVNHELTCYAYWYTHFQAIFPCPAENQR